MSSPEPRSRNPRARSTEPKLQGLFGVGLDDDGGHHRVTRGEEFTLVGGSAETHERMQDLVLRMEETLRKRGQRFQDLSRGEFEDLARDTF